MIYCVGREIFHEKIMNANDDEAHFIAKVVDGNFKNIHLIFDYIIFRVRVGKCLKIDEKIVEGIA